jgi:hypothetical protein
MIQAKLIKSLWLVVICTLLACQSGELKLNLSSKDLLEYGIPITLDVPDSADIKAMDWGIQKDVSIKGGSWYDMQIFSSKVGNHKLEAVVKDVKESVEEGTYFSKFITVETDGFVFEMMIDTMLNYDFRHIKVQGDNEYLFQAGMSGSYSQKQVEQLYQIAKAAQ